MPPNLLRRLCFYCLLATLYSGTSAIIGDYYYCFTSNSTIHSAYQSNLQLLLPSLSSAAVPTGFSAQSKGRPPDQVFGSALCRGDVPQDLCQSCLSTAAQELPQYCRSNRSGIMWYTNCLLYYSAGINVTSSSKDNDTIALRENRWFANEELNASEPRFAELLADLMASLTKRAAYGSPRLFATGEVNVTSSDRLYGLVQCTRDQSDDDCYQCLQRSVKKMSTRYPQSVAGVTLAYSCYVKHATYPFYNDSVGAAPPPPPVPVAYSSPPNSSPPPSRRKDSGNPDASFFPFS